MYSLCLIVLVVFAIPVESYWRFQEDIPNGKHVQDPCHSNHTWLGVGHLNPQGRGQRNHFGRDFAKAGRKWTADLCRKDSDGDGLTNGQELGDPDCVWTRGDTPQRVTDITHPGVCQPDGGACVDKESRAGCDVQTCEAMNGQDVKTLDLRINNVTIPSTDTQYYCQYFDLPDDENYHIVAAEGLVDQRNVAIVHHMIVFACPTDLSKEELKEIKKHGNQPLECSMGFEDCTSIVALWSFGVEQTCFGPHMGFRIGKGGYTKVKLEIHYNNEQHVSGSQDTSGMRIFYQPLKPEVQNLTTFVMGQRVLQIPPGEDKVVAQGTCSPTCSQVLLKEPVYVVRVANHMHYLGISQKTEILRNGTVERVLVHDDPFHYDDPKLHEFDPPFQMLPGDEIKTTCTFSSTTSDTCTEFGDSTTDEMCYAFFMFYPDHALAFPKVPACVSVGPLGACQQNSHKPHNNCTWWTFPRSFQAEDYFITLNETCGFTGKCSPECKQQLEDILDTEPCFQMDIRTFIFKQLEETLPQMAPVINCLVQACRPNMPEMYCQKECPFSNPGPTDKASAVVSEMTSIVLSLVALLTFLV